MLILHPSSRCDVCLDAYTWQSIAQTPHAIPCGHVFCRPCLFALTPYICPLCRKRFEPNKAKKLHVDRPENVDENRENDLLQRLAVSWEAPEDQLGELMYEVDTWLDTRADDTCAILRKARASLTRYLELKKAEMNLESALADIRTRFHDMELDYDAEQRKAVATETILKADNNALIRENQDLKAEVKELRTAYERSYWKNPLPPPPKPVSTEYVPSVAQALAHDRVRFDLPPTPTGPPYVQPFEVEGRKHRKGKAKSVDHRLVSPTSQNPYPLPTQLAKMDPSEETPVLISHFGHHTPRQPQISTPAPLSGLKFHFENTNQPLDGFELTQTYLREYSQGLLDGQLMAEKAASRPSTSQQPRASTSHSRPNASLLDDNEPTETRSIRSARTSHGREIQPVSGSSIVERSSRSVHQRQNTALSIATSDDSSTGQHSQNRSRSRPRPHSNQISLPGLLLNSAPSAPSIRPTLTPPINPSPDPSILSLSQSSHEQQPEPFIPPNFVRAESPAPSQRSKASSWGTIFSTSTNQTTYSLLGLRDFREGSYPRMVGSDGVNRVSSLISVVPAHESPVGSRATSPRTRDRNNSRTNSQRLSQYLPRPPSLISWHGSAASLSPSQTPDQLPASNGYHSDDGDENENENVMRSDDFLYPGYNNRDSAGSRPRTMESQHMSRGRNQPLPAVSPSFLLGESMIAEEDDRLNPNFMDPAFGNALGLELVTDPSPISAPTPVVPHRSFLRSFSDDT